MMRLLFIILAIHVGALRLSAQGEDTEMQEEVAKGIAHFAEFLGRQEVPAPNISSEWYIEGLEADMEEIEKLRADRALGELLLSTLDTYAVTVIAESGPPSEDRQHAERLLAIAEWIGGRTAYGNILIARRATDLAAVPICRLVANLEIPTEDTVHLIDRIKSASWYKPKFRSEALHAESSGQFPKVATQRGLEDAWQEGSMKAINWQTRDAEHRVSDLPPQDIAFFVDDPIYRVKTPLTTKNLWSAKLHENLFSGSSSARLNS